MRDSIQLLQLKLELAQAQLDSIELTNQAQELALASQGTHWSDVVLSLGVLVAVIWCFYLLFKLL